MCAHRVGRPKGPPKPIDRWLTIVGFVMGAALYLAPKTPAIVVGLLVMMFVLLFHPLWNFWWVEKTWRRRSLALAVLVIVLCWLGWIAWPPKQQLSVDLLYDSANKALNIVNRGGTNVYLWGDRLQGWPKSVDAPRTITPNGGAYHIWADRMAQALLQKLGNNGQDRIPFELYVSDEGNKKHIINYIFWVRIRDGVITIETQNMGTTDSDF